MKKEVLKDEMKKLWKDTFQDSDAYINLIFENYFDPALLEYYEENGQLIAGLLGVPYRFGTDQNNIKGLYLCGLSTRPEYRRRGIMHRLYDRIKEKAKDNGFDFVFLIPADNGLKRFYRDLGMSESFYHVKNRYTSAHDFNRDYLNYLEKEDYRVGALKKNYWESLNDGILDTSDYGMRKNVVHFINKFQQQDNPFGLLHSAKDMEAVIDENCISGGSIFVTYKKNEDITGVAFASFEDDSVVKVAKIYSADRCSHYRLLSAIKNKFSDCSMVVYMRPEEVKRVALKGEIYQTPSESLLSGSVGEALKPFDLSQAVESGGMIEFLNVREILIFLNNVRKDSKYSILVKDDKNGVITNFKSEKGQLEVNAIQPEVLSGLNMPIVMSEINLTDILCRKPDKDQFMMEAFGLPRLSLNIALLLE